MLKKLLKYALYIFATLTIVFGIFLLSVYYGAFGKLHSTADLQAFQNQTATLVRSEEGILIGKFFAENRTNIKYKQLPQHLINALVATEDARYFKHDGVDSRSLLRVFFKTILANKKHSGGGSTINQQLVKNMYGRENHGFLTMPVNKVKEAFLAYRLEKVFDKNEILTLYLNTVPFGENVLGIEAASRRFFNKSIDKIKIDEAAILVGMLKANTYYNPRLYPKHALKRRNTVLAQMEKYQYITPTLLDSLKLLPIKLNYANLESEGPANYFLVHVKKEASKILDSINKIKKTNYQIDKDGLIINTTLNNTLQNSALKAFNSHLSVMQERIFKQYSNGNYRKKLNKLVLQKLKSLKLKPNDNTKKKRELFSWKGFLHDSISIKDSIRYTMELLHAGLFAMNPKNGAVKVWVGGIDFRTQQYDQIFAQRQLASTFKPILYATALERGMLPCTYLENDSIVLEAYDDWRPENYDHSIGGEYSLAAALAHSMNIPTVNLFLQIPFEDLNNTWKNLGFKQELINKPSIALGAVSASIYELAIAYSAFANGGYRIKPQIIKSIQTADGKYIYNNKLNKQKDKRVLKESTSQLLSAILQKAVNEGTGIALRSKYNIRIPLAAKTGTSQDYADAWFAAYNPKLVLVTRVGATLPSIHFSSGANGSGSRLALPLIAKTLQPLQQKYSATFPLSEAFSDALSCDDYRETTAISELEDFFSRFFKRNKENSTTNNKQTEREIKRAKRKKKRDSIRAERKKRKELKRARRRAKRKKRN